MTLACLFFFFDPEIGRMGSDEDDCEPLERLKNLCGN